MVAPDTEKSSVGHGITLAHPILFTKVTRHGKFFGYGITGTPADCVKFGVSVILKRKPDCIVSGINLGPNDGCSVFYSGTVAGAREGALMGIPSMAVSLAGFLNPNFSYATQFVSRFIKRLKTFKIPKHTFLNVNIPNLPARKIKGIRITHQGMVPIHGTFKKRTDPNFRIYYWMSGKNPPIKGDFSVDTYALNHGYITITPIHCDLTDYRFMESVSWKKFV